MRLLCKLGWPYFFVYTYGGFETEGGLYHLIFEDPFVDSL